MLLTRHLRLTAPLLAGRLNQDTTDPKRVFTRVNIPRGEPEGPVYLSTPLQRWNWAFLEAKDALIAKSEVYTEISPGSIIPCYWFSVKRTSTYNRNYRRGDTPAVDKFESIQTNQTFTIRFTLPKTLAPKTDGAGRFIRPPDELEFDAMLAHIGVYLGMSEWGQNFGYGRFEICEKTPA